MQSSPRMAGLALVLFLLPRLAIAQIGAPDMILTDGKIVTVDARDTLAQALAIKQGRISAVGSAEQIRALTGPGTVVVDLGGRTVIPGLIDSHIHAIRDALYYTTLVDWGDISDIKGALDSIRAEARKSGPGAWITVVGGWARDQLREKRAPTPQELDEAAPDNPVFIQHLFDFAVLNSLAMKTLGITAQTSLPPAGKVLTDNDGRPTGVLAGGGSALTFGQLTGRILKPGFSERVASTRAYFHRLNRLAITGIMDEGGIAPSDYRPLFSVWREGGLTLRVRYDFMAEHAGRELADYQQLLALLPSRLGDDWLRFVGPGEIVVFGMYDGSLVAKDVKPTPEAKKALLEFSSWAAQNGYTIHIHSSHNTNAMEILDVFEEVNRTVPIGGLRWAISHIEDASDATLARMKALGVGFAVQDRMYFGGDAYMKDHDPAVVHRAPPIVSAMRMGVVVSAGTDANWVTPYNPFVSLRWLLNGQTLAGTATRSAQELPSRTDALRMYTLNGAWMSFDEADRGSLEPGKLADLAVLDRDYMTVPVEEIAKIQSLLTLAGGHAVYAAGPYEHFK
jgi:predicted amidohydrolase YtcJ